MIWKSEPHYQNQNFSERRYWTVKRLINTIIDRTGASVYTCLLSLIYVCFILNHTHADVIKGIPITKDAVSNSDISPLFRFRFFNHYITR